MAFLMGPEFGGAEERGVALHQEVKLRVKPRAARKIKGLPHPWGSAQPPTHEGHPTPFFTPIQVPSLPSSPLKVRGMT